MGDRGDFSQKFYFLFNLLMILLYATGGIILIFARPPREMLPDLNRIGLGIILLLYAAYRSYRLFRKKTAKNSAIASHE